MLGENLHEGLGAVVYILLRLEDGGEVEHILDHAAAVSVLLLIELSKRVSMWCCLLVSTKWLLEYVGSSCRPMMKA
jgi:hypothetical protein